MVFANAQNLKQQAPQNPFAHMNVAQVVQFCIQNYNAGQYIPAFHAACECVLREPLEEMHKLRLSTVITPVRIVNFDRQVKSAIGLSIQSRMVNPQQFWAAWLGVLLADPLHAGLKNLWEVFSYEDFKSKVRWDALKKSLSDPFLQEGLRTIIPTTGRFETLMMHLRRWLLYKATTSQMLQHAELPFLSALAEHFFLKEYPAPETEEEKEALAAIHKEIEAGKADAAHVLLFAAYRPLYTLPAPEKILEDYGSVKSLQVTLNTQIRNFILEQDIRKTLKSVSDIEDKTSRKVQDMYEENPYPRWSRVSVNPVFERDVTGDVLIAGCGTSRSTMPFALKYVRTQIDALDLSRASLAYSQRKANAYGAWNITYHHGDILSASALNKEYDLIECSGVLHHMADPVAGWKSLLSVLKPGGRMNIGLYSTRAREAVFNAQKEAKENGVTDSADDIRAFRYHLLALPDDHPAKAITHSRDFFSLSECRDLIFHVQEKTYTLSEIKDILDALNLSFLGFFVQHNPLGAIYAQMFPKDTEMRNWDNCLKLEEKHPSAFAGMYQFICCRAGEEDAPNALFDHMLSSQFISLTGSK